MSRLRVFNSPGLSRYCSLAPKDPGSSLRGTVAAVLVGLWTDSTNEVLLSHRSLESSHQSPQSSNKHPEGTNLM